jgi:GTP cyclohydrolase FolE2
MTAAAPTPIADRRQVLPDVQAEAPAHALALGRVGVAGMKLPLALAGGQAIATLDLAVDLPAVQRGVHMSRFRRAIDDVADGLDPSAFAQALGEELLRRHSYAKHADVTLTTETSIADLVLPSTARVHVGAPAEPELSGASSITLRTTGATVCPCSFAMSDHRYAHVQRAEIRLEVLEPRLGIPELHAICARAFSAPAAMVLDRPGEKALVDRMFAHPRFVEDVAREAVVGLKAAGAGRAAKLVATAFESIHPYDCFAEWAGLL